MASVTPVILIGGFPEIEELCSACGCAIVGIIDPSLTGTFMGHRVLGTDADAERIAVEHPGLGLILSPDEPGLRRRLWRRYQPLGFNLATAVHPSAVISTTASLAEGVVIQHGAHASTMCQIEKGVRLNVRANVMHGCRIGAFSTVAPNAVVLGRVDVGEGCYIGANATVLPGLRIGDGALVGASAVVTRDVERGTVVKGNPARPSRGDGSHNGGH